LNSKTIAKSTFFLVDSFSEKCFVLAGGLWWGVLCACGKALVKGALCLRKSFGENALGLEKSLNGNV